jgi:hypothetical protein
MDTSSLPRAHGEVAGVSQNLRKVAEEWGAGIPYRFDNKTQFAKFWPQPSKMSPR